MPRTPGETAVPAAGFEVSPATETALEFPALLRLVAHLTASDLGRERVAGLRPFDGEESLRRHRRRYEEARRLIGVRALVPLCERPFAPLLGQLAAGGRGLEGRDLVEIGELLRIAAGAAERIADADPPCPELAAMTARVPPCDELRRVLRKTFDARGEIREDATPRLAEIRGRLRSVRQRIYDQLRSQVEAHREHLSEETIPLRAGRLVLVLQAGARGRVKGLIHGRSGSGKSFYFEPLEAVENNNQLQQLVEDEEEEKRRLLAELIGRLRDELPALEAHADLVAELDHLQASVRFAEKSGGVLAELGGRHDLLLKAARHPLLDPALQDLRGEALGTPGHGKAVVPLDLELVEERRALVVTGPNAGGKTVALKTLGLLALAHQCGLPIPVARGSRLPFLGALVATVGDDQDLFADRSTFSGRLLRLREAWEAAGDDALVLLDELGSGTDPAEGGALATAVLEGFLDRRCLLVITTHLIQVAAAALEADGAFCAAMLFDADTGEPTFRLLPGPPGGSEALALARRMGLPDRWLARAEELLGSEHRDLRRLLAEVERTRQELIETQSRLDAELADAAKLRRRLAEREEELREERENLGPTFRQRLERFRDETTRRLRDEVERLREELEEGRRKGLAADAAERLFEEAPEFVPAAETEGEIEVGGDVRHRRLGWVGTLEKLERGRAQVKVRGKSLTCPAGELVPAAEVEAKRAKPQPGRPSRPAVRVTGDGDAESVPRELKLLGERVEPALHSLDRYLDRALLASLPTVRIVHGHGSGRLRKAVRDHLRAHPAVASLRPGRANEGGDGATVVDLAG